MYNINLDSFLSFLIKLLIHIWGTPLLDRSIVNQIELEAALKMFYSEMEI